MPETAKSASFAEEIGVLRAKMKAVFGEQSPEAREVIDILLDLQGEAEYVDVIRRRAIGEWNQGKIPDKFPRHVKETIRDLEGLLAQHQEYQGTAS